MLNLQIEGFGNIILLAVVIMIHALLNSQLSTPLDIKTEQFTIRVNTFRRNDLLSAFLDHYTRCEEVKLIQIVWSDQKNAPPYDWLPNYPPHKVKFEVHSEDSLNNRFKSLEPVPTEGVLSIDDDLIITCDTLRMGAKVWQANKNALVGFSPRLATIDVQSGVTGYLGWQKTWGTGIYSIMLSKVAFVHRDYLSAYHTHIPPGTLQHIQENRNCEDIALASLVGAMHQRPPVWVKGVVFEMAESGISSGGSHYELRSACVRMLRENLISADRDWVLPPSIQKALPMSFFDGWRLLRGAFK
jgi:hypothetical protein